MSKNMHTIRAGNRYFSRALVLVLASSSVLLESTSRTHAEECLTAVSSALVADFSPCSQNGLELDVNAALPAGNAMATSGAMPWFTGEARIPATLSPSADGVSVRTSLDTLRDYNMRAASRGIDGSASSSTTAGFALPKARAVQQSAIDVWSNVDVDGYEGARDQSVTTGVGADFRMTPVATVGVSAQQEMEKSEELESKDRQSKVSTYVKLRAAPGVSFEARSDWQNASSASGGIDGLALSDTNSASVTPTLKSSIELNNGKSIEPFVSYTHQSDKAPALTDINAAAGAQSSAGAGLKYTAPDAYSLSVTADVEGMSKDVPESVSSKLQLSVPIR